MDKTDLEIIFENEKHGNKFLEMLKTQKRNAKKKAKAFIINIPKTLVSEVLGAIPIVGAIMKPVGNILLGTVTTKLNEKRVKCKFQKYESADNAIKSSKWVIKYFKSIHKNTFKEMDDKFKKFRNQTERMNKIVAGGKINTWSDVVKIMTTYHKKIGYFKEYKALVNEMSKTLSKMNSYCGGIQGALINEKAFLIDWVWAWVDWNEWEVDEDWVQKQIESSPLLGAFHDDSDDY